MNIKTIITVALLSAAVFAGTASAAVYTRIGGTTIGSDGTFCTRAGSMDICR